MHGTLAVSLNDTFRIHLEYADWRNAVIRKLSDYSPDEPIPAASMATLFPGTTAQTWNSMRHSGTGPKFIKIARRIYYRRCDVEAWLDANTRTRSDQAEKATR